MTLSQYIDKINTLYKTGNAREHSYRGDLQNLIMAILPDVLVTNEPARVDCGAPDYVLTRKDVPVGYIEAKDIGVDLGSKTLKEQFDRYKSGLSNLIFTDYMDFHFYKDGELTTKIAIAKIENGSIVPITENFDQFNKLIKNFAETISQTIKSPTKLAQMMAGKARLMADIIEKSLSHDDQEGKRSQLKSQMLSFQQMLIHDIDNKAFSDIYAQTIAYGMFAARYHDPTLPTFSRMEAGELIPKSNPFLRKLFQDIAGFDLDTRLVWIVDELVNIFLASDVAQIMRNFGKSTKQEDPVVHFYETFLGEYNPALRKARGVWYTPQPVVNFIVRAVDDILKTEFNLPQGLADTSKTKIKQKAVTQTGKGANSKIKEVETETEVHKVQILDPATGTGTFLAEVVKHIHKKFEGQQGIWSKYVTNDLIPRLNGFELLMASYAMAHLKMDMLLTETGYKPTDDQRFKIFLTNSLEEAHPDTQTLFSSWLSDEADQANAIKRDAPVMVVIGNPPYAVSSTNKNEWIQNLIADYKKDLNERKINLDDDYIKFTRFGQHFIDKNGEGILAYISNNSFIDGITHRQMRKHLLESFDKIYILDLHGNSKKKEVSPDGSPDQNVFDIMQGVSINLFIKTGKKKKDELGEVFNYDLYGKREFKYDFLNQNLKDLKWTKINYEKPYYFFIQKNYNILKKYETGFSIDSLFSSYNSGIQTKNDSLTIKFTDNEIKNTIDIFKEFDENEITSKLNIKDSAGWKVNSAITDIKNNKGVFTNINYRLFDFRKTYFTGKSSGFIGRTRGQVMSSMLKDNYSLIFKRTGKVYGNSYDFIFVSKFIVSEGFYVIDPLGREYLAPLYLYPEITDQATLLDEEVRTPNLNMEIVNEIAKGLGLAFTPEKEDGNVCLANDKDVRSEYRTTFAPIDLLDYIYAVLHSPTYRETYKEFLKIDFPRVPYPKDSNIFWQLVQLGGELRQIHLLESPIVEKYITQYPEDGDNIVKKPVYKNGNVYINETQYFANVPEVAWNFYIGGYQPAQKWLKDRKDRELGFEDILHYQKIIVALSETDRIMKEIDKIEI
ncbi:type ISP restriction/modification enzyme [Flavobacterium lacisediminis]|uniref:site-specific DNA-methyltransferase (adenine-specific) n=1 Tax=Flavobacterium lacisediminis TaxID=2989705 RepID=A0ABT3EHY6_9FLAO|nr:type ISP restriction/modification enzyme [Flavobacterium lacisediminis]MCW1148044.1 N-6 DNA methylase [Flavobacterium lacisediminis]